MVTSNMPLQLAAGVCIQLIKIIKNVAIAECTYVGGLHSEQSMLSSLPFFAAFAVLLFLCISGYVFYCLLFTSPFFSTRYYSKSVYK